MNPLICAIAYCEKDAKATLELLEWINELGGCPAHSCLLVVDSKVQPQQAAFIKMAAESAFAFVEEIQFVEPPPPAVLRWPLWRYFANCMFLRSAKHIFDTCRGPFFWLEPDAVPTKPGWLDALSESYYAQPKKYHGPRIEKKTQDVYSHIPKVHMAGVAIYPNTAAFALEKFCSGEDTWDMGGAAVVVPQMSKCRLIQHSYAPPTATDENTGWTFHVVKGKLVADGDPGFCVRDDAVIFHRCKDGSLIRALRQLRKAENGHIARDGGRDMTIVHTKIDGWGNTPIGSEKDFDELKRAGQARPRKVPVNQ